MLQGRLLVVALATWAVACGGRGERADGEPKVVNEPPLVAGTGGGMSTGGSVSDSDAPTPGGTPVPGAERLPSMKLNGATSGPTNHVVFGSTGTGLGQNGEVYATATGEQFETIFSSADGWSWERAYQGPAGEVEGVAYGNGHYLALARPVEGPASMLTSTDGETWAELPAPGAVPVGLAFGNGVFVLRDYADGLVYTSANGDAWQAAPPPSFFNTLDFAAGRFVAATAGALYTSELGVDWQPVSYSGLPVEHMFAFGDRFVATTYESCCNHEAPLQEKRGYASSTDGLTWSLFDAPTSEITFPLVSDEASCLGLRFDVTSPVSAILVSGPDCAERAVRVNYVTGLSFSKGLYLATTGSNVVSSRDGSTWTKTLSPQ